MMPWILLVSFAAGCAIISIVIVLWGYFRCTFNSVLLAYEASKWASLSLLVGSVGLYLIHVIGLNLFLAVDIATVLVWHTAVGPIRARRDHLRNWRISAVQRYIRRAR
jgi:hypothetical protein